MTIVTTGLPVLAGGGDQFALRALQVQVCQAVRLTGKDGFFTYKSEYDVGDVQRQQRL